MIIIYAPPCAGKTTAQSHLRKLGYNVVDTDDLIPAGLETTSKEKDDALKAFAQTRDGQCDVLVTNLISSLIRLNLEPDLAFYFKQKTSLSNINPSILATRFKLRHIVNGYDEESMIPEATLCEWDASTHKYVHNSMWRSIMLNDDTYVITYIDHIVSMIDKA